jgi:anti-anti-sigma factor
MKFDATLTTTGKSAVITVRGTLDENSEGEFQQHVERAAELDIAELVIDMTGLNELTAMGVRSVAYSCQRMPDDVQLVITSPAGQVREALLAADFMDGVAIRG